jgi:DNA modification methylase
MAVRILRGNCRETLKTIADGSVHCVCTSPPYWGLRDYGVDGQLGMEPTLGEHIEVMVDLFREVRRVLRPDGVVWVNYGDCYAATPNGRSAGDVKALGTDDRTFRDKPFSTIGPVYVPDYEKTARVGASENKGSTAGAHGGRVAAGGYLKPKDLCLVPQRFAIAMQADGWWVRAALPWVKRNPMPESTKDRPSSALEWVFLFSKSERYFWDAEAVMRGMAATSLPRLAQDVEGQDGSARANGATRADRPMKAVRGRSTHGRHTLGDALPEADRRDKQAGHGQRHAGFNDRWDAKVRGTTARHSQYETNHQSLDGVERGLRSFRNTDLFFDSLTAPHGLICDADGQPIAIDVPTRPFSEAHFATFPPNLIAPLIRAGCPAGGTVLDPFGGSGTTGLVADRLGRDAILCELNPGYADMAERRISGDAPLFVEMAS